MAIFESLSQTRRSFVLFSFEERPFGAEGGLVSNEIVLSAIFVRPDTKRVSRKSPKSQNFQFCDFK